MADRSVEIKLSSECNPVDALVEAFAKAKRSIDAAVYKFNLCKIFEALNEAIDRGVKVRLVVDCDKKDGFARTLAKKENEDVTIRKWTGHKLHAKFVIIDDRLVLSGSYNWTKSAWKKNIELLLRFDDAASVGRFTNLFEELWKEAKQL